MSIRRAAKLKLSLESQESWSRKYHGPASLSQVSASGGNSTKRGPFGAKFTIRTFNLDCTNCYSKGWRRKCEPIDIVVRRAPIVLARPTLIQRLHTKLDLTGFA